MPAAVEVIGQLTPLTTVRSPALVHCFVGYFRTVGPESLAFVFDPGEVEKVFWVPLAGLAVEGIYHEELWPAPENDGGTVFRAVPFFRLEDDVVWGATGRLLTELIGAVLARQDARRNLKDARGSREGTLAGHDLSPLRCGQRFRPSVLHALFGLARAPAGPG